MSRENDAVFELLKRLEHDDEQAFKMIFDRFKGLLFATALKMTKCKLIAEEIVQEVFVSLWIKRKQVAGAKNPESYFLAIFHNCTYTHFRRVTRERELKFRFHERVMSEVDTAETLLQKKQERTVIEKVINKLPPQQKLIYRLAKQEGIGRDEIAKKLHLSPNTVRNHLAAATEYVRSYFENRISAPAIKSILFVNWFCCLASL